VRHYSCGHGKPTAAVMRRSSSAGSVGQAAHALNGVLASMRMNGRGFGILGRAIEKREAYHHMGGMGTGFDYGSSRE